jgi:AAA ATPase domain
VGGASARSKVRSTDGQQLSRFIGRGAELKRLHALPELARAGQGQVAAVSSEAGLGKTRLLYEFLHSAKTQPWRILEGRSHSYERAASYRPIIELLRAYFELDALDPASRVTERVAATIRDLDPGPGDAVAPLLSLLDVMPSDDPFRALWARRRPEPSGGARTLRRGAAPRRNAGASPARRVLHPEPRRPRGAAG